MTTITKEQSFQELWNHGFFTGFDVIIQKYNPDISELTWFKSFLYNKILQEVVEAKNEAARLQKTLERMEAKCRQGARAPGNPRMGWDANATSLQGDVQAVDGWTVSLFESNITLLHYILSIETAHNRSTTLHSSMRSVIEKRRAELKFSVSDPAAFKLKLI